MSKSLGNVVNPDELVDQYGADSVRLYEMFMGPFEDGQPWNTKGVIGTSRFLNRVWNFVGRFDPATAGKPNPEAEKIINKYIKDIGESIDKFSFNTSVSGLMKLLNEIESHTLAKKEYESFLKLLAPFAPHITEELWHSVLKNKKSIHLELWPTYDILLLAEEEVQVAVQVNGRVRDILKITKVYQKLK
jgi:leucyl-tRNA synthetase